MFLLAAACALSVAGACVQPTEQGGAAGGAQNRAPKKAGEKVKIGFSMDTLKEERWQRDKEHVEQYAREAGADLEVQVANGDDAAQTKQCETMLTKGVDVLIVAPHNGVAAAAIVQMAKQRGVPVISYDRLIRNSDVDLYVSHQVEKMGEMQGQYAFEKVPRGNYVLIGGAQTDNNALLLRKGQLNVLQPAIDRGDIKVISDLYARDWLASEAQRITEDALTRAGGKVDAIVASNDGTAGGAIAGLPPALVGKVLVTGQDAALDGIQRIVEGKQTMTIYKPIKPLAKSAVDAAVQLARGEALSAPDRINNGKIDVPSILHAPQAVDKANVMQTVIADGYHKFDDVYKNVPPDQRPKQTTAAAGVAPTFVFPLLFLGAALFAGVVLKR
ncbi:MAG TPA: substrate-binding domain-containing protein [Pyrinomonadaceae bacterium]